MSDSTHIEPVVNLKLAAHDPLNNKTENILSVLLQDIYLISLGELK